MTDQPIEQEDRPLVLVVDDDWMNREVMEAQLQHAGCDVLLAHNGPHALQLVEEHPPDLILLDINMPGMSGYEVCARLKSHEKMQFTPIVMVTALESDADKIKAIQAGADDFLTKPFNSVLMHTRIRSLLRIKQLHDELESKNDLLRRVLNRYVNEDIVDIILVNPERYLKLGGDTRTVTVFFADIRGFTAFAEQQPAHEVLKILNYTFNELTEVVFANHGTLDKYIGDELMAFFGAPVATGDDTLNALHTAWEMQVVFKRVRSEIETPGIEKLGLGIGLHTGEVAIGNVGSERVMSYTVIGDVVNTARRIQQAAPGGSILLSEKTYRQVAPLVEAERLDAHMFSGKSESIVVYQLHGIRSG
ncbi:response regulator [Chloroflexota bacterium]